MNRLEREERFGRILSLLEKRKFLTVEALSREIYVSPSTIRRDLAEMARSGYLLRSRGGAAAISSEKEAEAVFPGQEAQPAAHDAVARHAVSLVRDGDLLFLDSSRLTLAMAPLLAARRGLTIVTNSLTFLSEFPAKSRGCRLLCCAGTVDTRGFSTRGSAAEQDAARFHYDWAFVSCSGVVDGHAACHSLATAALLHTAMRHARRSILLCSAEKLDLAPPCALADLRDFDWIVTDAAGDIPGAPPERVMRTASTPAGS